MCARVWGVFQVLTMTITNIPSLQTHSYICNLSSDSSVVNKCNENTNVINFPSSEGWAHYYTHCWTTVLPSSSSSSSSRLSLFLEMSVKIKRLLITLVRVCMCVCLIMSWSQFLWNKMGTGSWVFCDAVAPSCGGVKSVQLLLQVIKFWLKDGVYFIMTVWFTLRVRNVGVFLLHHMK